jgi:hypothetical protein
MQSSLSTLKYQIKLLERKLEDQPEMIGGKYNRKYFSLKAKISNLKKEVAWEEYLAK